MDKITTFQCHVCYKKQKSYWITTGGRDCKKSHCGSNDCFHKCWDASVKAEADAVPQETKQKLLDLLHEGKTIGEAQEACGLDTLITGKIITDNIQHMGFDFLRKEAK